MDWESQVMPGMWTDIWQKFSEKYLIQKELFHSDFSMQL